jgi:hypothetical protein
VITKRVQLHIRVGLGLAAILVAFAAAPASAASRVLHDGDSAHRQVSTVYYPDDICGPRSGWTTYVTSFQWKYTERGDGSFNFVYLETGTYHTDFDDPTIPSYDSQFTGAQHGTVTRGGTAIFTSQWHDFPGTITIHEQIVFVQVGDQVKLNRDVLRVDGCP